MNFDQFWKQMEPQKEEKHTPASESFADSETTNWEDAFDFDEVTHEEGPSLISPDAYEYLDNPSSGEFPSDEMLDEQDSDDFPMSENMDFEQEEDMDDSELYSVSSLFDMDDEEQPGENFEEKAAEPVTEPVEEPAALPMAEPMEEPFIESEPEPVAEIIPESEDPHSSIPLFHDIFSVIGSQNAFGSYLRSLSDSDADDLVTFIDFTKKAWMTDNRDKMFNLPGSDITLSVLTDVDDPMGSIQRLEGVGAQMFAHDKETWNWLKLYFNADGSFKRVALEKISQKNFSEWQWRIVQHQGFKLWQTTHKDN